MGLEIERLSPRNHYTQVCRLLAGCSVEPPREEADLEGYGFVAVKGEDIVGVIWALAHPGCSRAYVDYWAVRKDFQKTPLAIRLCDRLDAELRRIGVKRYLFHVEKWNHYVFQGMFKHREKLRMTLLRPLHTLTREIGR